ncbi:MAG: porin family protein [Alphaproteobacteria bacterium]|nr:porin family protein [Alphaproteobacteria bacterium]
MNRIFPFAATCAFALLPLSDAQAKMSRLYMAGYMGLNVYPVLDISDGRASASGELEVKNSLAFAGALGLRLTKKVSVEAEVGYASADMDSLEIAAGGENKIGGQLRTTTVLLTGIYNFDEYWERLNPFVTGGIGFAFHDGKIEDPSGAATNVSDSDIGLAWTMGGGMRYRVRDGFAFTGAYRYVGSTDIGLESTDVEYGAHEFRVGVQYDLHP